MQRAISVATPGSSPNLELHWSTKPKVAEVRCAEHHTHAELLKPAQHLAVIKACCDATLDAAEGVVRIHYGVPINGEEVN